MNEASVIISIIVSMGILLGWLLGLAVMVVLRQSDDTDRNEDEQ